MNYRVRKQINIVLILALFLCLVGTAVYFRYFKLEPTCFDNKRNQNEEGVDCGGPCFSCERLTIRQPKIDWFEIAPLNESQYDLIAQISNPNPNFGLVKLNYAFKYYSASDFLLGEKKGETYILPNQTKYLVEAGINVSQPIERTEIVLAEAPKAEWQRLTSDFELPDLYVYNKQFKILENQPAKAEASGIIKNKSVYDFDKVQIAVVLFDESKKVIGVNKTEARTILAGEERYFSTLWFNQFKKEMKSAEFQVDTNLFSQNNFMRRYGAQEKFQEYQTEIKK